MTGSERNRVSSQLLKTSFISLTIILLVILFVFMGNTHDPANYGPSILSWLPKQWMASGGESGHCWFIPVVSLAIVWMKRRKLAAARKDTDSRALVIIIVSLVLYWAGCRSQQPRLGLICLIGLSWGIPFFLWGSAVAKILLFPCSYLFFAIPMAFLTAFTFPLRLFSTVVSVSILNGLNVATIREGTAIHCVAAGSFALDIAGPCSGLQSLIAMTALTAVYAYFTQKGIVKKWILFFSAVPLAMAGNVARIVTIALVSRALGLDIAMKIYHDYSGYIVFGTAIVLMTSFGALLNRDFSLIKERWISKA